MFRSQIIIIGQKKTKMKTVNLSTSFSYVGFKSFCKFPNISTEPLNLLLKSSTKKHTHKNKHREQLKVNVEN